MIRTTCGKSSRRDALSEMPGGHFVAKAGSGCVRDRDMYVNVISVNE